MSIKPDAQLAFDVVTRFAPSPTGLLHLGHVANAAYVWGFARANQGTVALRMEDHDRGRFRVEYETAILRDLEWLGFEPDVGGFDTFRRGATSFRQSDCAARYQQLAEQLRDAGLVYACECTRAEIRATHDARPGEEGAYSGTCRDKDLPDRLGRGLRVVLPAESVMFDDLNLDRQVQEPSRQCGDMLIRDRAGNWTYQFCVTADDLLQGMTVVIRGEDLLASTGRQLALRSLLGATADLRFYHHPLIRDCDGRKLSKRDGDLGLAALRERGMSPQEVLGRAVFLVGLHDNDEPLEVQDLPTLFRKT